MPRESRLARNEALFREVNERIAELANPRIGEDIQILCECANTGCQSKIPVSIEAYKRVRENPRRFLIVPGHTVPEIEDVVEQQAGYEIVEKYTDVAVIAALESVEP